MVINSLLKIGMEKLEKRDYSNPLLESRLLLTYLLDVDDLYVYVNGNEEVSEENVDKFLKLLEKRSNGYPLQYILNEANFMGLDFYVEDGVLIPRSDTEVLVEYVLEYIDSMDNKDIRLLDIGIGSGAIVLSTAYHRPFIDAYGVDIEDKPIYVTKKNIEKFGLSNVKIYKGDLFEPFDFSEFYNSFDIITSNPPYIESEDIETLQVEVSEYEPMSALDGGEDGLIFYRRIAKRAKRFLSENGLLIFEIGYNQGESVSEILKEEGYKNISVLKDIQDLDRVVLAYI